MTPFDMTSYIMGYDSGLRMAADNKSDQDNEILSQDPEDAETDEEQDSDT